MEGERMVRFLVTAGLLGLVFGAGWYLAERRQVAVQPSSDLSVMTYRDELPTDNTHAKQFTFTIPENTVIKRVGEGEGGPALDYDFLTVTKNPRVYEPQGAPGLTLTVTNASFKQGLDEQKTIDDLFRDLEAKEKDSSGVDVSNLTRRTVKGHEWARYEVGGFCEGKVAERSEEHTSELQSQSNLVCRLLLEK